MTNLAPGLMNREDVRIPCTTMATVWSAAMDQTGEPNLAMKLGVERIFGANRTTNLIMESSSTVLESFQLAARYSVLVADVMDVEIGESEGTVYIEFRPTPTWAEQPERVQLDCLAITYLSAVTSLQSLLGTEQAPSVLWLRFPRPAIAAAWEAALGCEVTFDAPANRIGFPAELTRRPIATGDPALKAALRQYADDLAESFASDPACSGEVMATIARELGRELGPETPSVVAMASELSMSPRSLQRRLRAEGQTYRGLVERVRLDLAERYLQNGAHSVERVAELVGYADGSSFVRAFKRSKGQPPGEYSRHARHSRRAAGEPTSKGI